MQVAPGRPGPRNEPGGSRPGRGESSPGAGVPRTGALLSLLGVLFLAAACGTARAPTELAPPELFTWAVEKFEEGDYRAAIPGFTEFVIRDPLNPRVDSAQYLLGESYLRRGQELRAVNEFQQLVRTRPNSHLADDAQLGTCRAYWRLSPSIARDQEDTRRAVEECNRLLELFPGSPLREEAREIVLEAREKLAEKAFRVGKHYLDRRLYESANIYFEMALEEDPEADIIPEVLAALYQSYRRIGFDSEAETVRQRLLRDHGDTEQARELRDAPAAANG